MSRPNQLKPTRRAFALSLGALAGGMLGYRAGPPTFAQDDDHDDHGRGRGRGRGDDRSDTVPLTAELPAGAHAIFIVNDDADGFSPSTLTVNLDDVVAFANTHDDDHTATGAGIDTGVIAPGAVATLTMGTPGEFRYACQFHPEMTGIIRVRDESGAVPASKPDAISTTTVTIASLAFQPAAITAPPAATVTWTNDDSVPHTVTAGDGSFDSGILDPGATFSHTFDQPGVFEYLCLVHPNMVGSVHIGDDPAPPTSEASPVAAAQASSLTGLWSLFLAPAGDNPGYQALVELAPDGSSTASLAPVAESAARVAAPALGAWHSDGATATVVLVALTLSPNDVATGTFRLEIELEATGDQQVAGNWRAGPDAAIAAPGAVSGVQVPLDSAP